MSLKVTPIPTSIFRPGDDLVEFLVKSIMPDRLKRGSVLAITSKIVSLSENALVPRSQSSKLDLVRKEADLFLGEYAYGTALTVKHGLLIPSAGIDESNSENENYIVYPKEPYLSAKSIHLALQDRLGFGEFGIILTDSHTQPLRRGVTGIGLAHWGFRATRTLIGTPDLFGHTLKMTQINILDSLAVAAVFMMGEAAESCPLAVIEGAQVEFCSESEAADIQVSIEDDLYRPILRL